jgi:hypothetical protein
VLADIATEATEFARSSGVYRRDLRSFASLYYHSLSSCYGCDVDSDDDDVDRSGCCALRQDTCKMVLSSKKRKRRKNTASDERWRCGVLVADGMGWDGTG